MSDQPTLTHDEAASKVLNAISAGSRVNTDQAIAHAQALATLSLFGMQKLAVQELRTANREARTANLIAAAALAVAVDGPTVDITADIAEIDARLGRKAPNADAT